MCRILHVSLISPLWLRRFELVLISWLGTASFTTLSFATSEESTVSLVDTWVWNRIFTHCVRISWHGILLSEALLLVNNWVIDGLVMTVSNLLVPTISWGVTLWIVSTEVCWSLHVGQNLGETLTISGDPLAWVPERQFLVCKEVSWLSVEISNILFTRGASYWSERLLREHCVISTWSSWLLSKKLHDFSDLFTQLCESLHNVIFIRELAQNLVYHIFQFLHDSIFKFSQFPLVRLMR